MWRSLFGPAILLFIVLASCKEDDDPEDLQDTSSASDGGDIDPTMGDGSARDVSAYATGTVDGEQATCRCDDEACTVTYRGDTIQSGRKIEIAGIIVANEGRCLPLL